MAKLGKGDSADLTTFNVTGSQALLRPDGRVAIALYFGQEGIAFEVNQHAIDTLRRELATAEQFLRQPTGKA